MKINGQFLILGAAFAGFALSGCVSSPTYGTDKTAGAQLLDDMSNIASFGSRNNGQRIEYKPRPELVKPVAGRAATLPAPQESVARSGANWPESPEARRKRLRDEATANQGNPNYVSPIAGDGPVATSSSSKNLASANSRAADRASRGSNLSPEQSAEIIRRRQVAKTGSPTSRRYLSEPPLDYRQPASSAPVGDVGEDEARKERERKAAARGSKSWRNYLPW
ncbi:hypothetical protein C5748_19275 [Phyllobacterium phragmitis]|uniref:Lipoprotein n=1 Tax=Phyllobacterium phragmitis TaxID=2670329 RepID=A0A2S9IMT9_9HYPH|nr:hypothetical protein [Phyllobacterium phragmitis]PRD41802.1 hypothetical protein C5748_19275 [Phyllobacterium phragmitis]